MKAKTTTLFIDTNAFLQLRDLKDIPWHSQFPDSKRVDLVVIARVIDELDKHKMSTNDRKRDRARAALKLIQEASKAEGFVLTLKGTPIEVRLTVSTSPPLDWNALPNLDREKPDDHLVAEAARFGDGARVFSHDTGPLVRARIAGVPAYEPLPEWLLPSERTDDQKQIAELKRELERARNTKPLIVVEYEGAHAGTHEGTSQIDLAVPTLPPLDTEKVSLLAKNYLALNPIESFGGRGGFTVGYPDNAINDYREEYSGFLTKVHAFFRNLHTAVARQALAVPVSYFVKNESGISAEGLRIEHYIDDGAMLLVNRDAAKRMIGSLNLPKPPRRPRTLFESPEITFPGMQGLLNAREPRDPLRFYWIDEPEFGSTHAVQQCEEFRATNRFDGQIFILSRTAPPATHELKIHVSAKNLASPLEILANVSIENKPSDWADPIVQAILPSKLRKLLS